jgi:hypothetical protein
MGLPELKADCKLQREQLLDMSLPTDPTELGAWVKNYLANEVWAHQEAVVEEALHLGDAVDELIDTSESVIFPELTAKIVGVIEYGKLICKEVDKFLEDCEDDLTKKRVTEMVKNYRQAAEVVTDEVAESAVPMEEEDADVGEEEVDEASPVEAIDDVAEVADVVDDEDADDEVDDIIDDEAAEG